MPAELTFDEGIATLTLNRPEVRNAIDQQMVDALHEALAEVEALALKDDPEVRVLVLTGAGKAFAAGADIAQLRDRGAAAALRRINQGLFNRIEAAAVPTIAAVEGWCLGGGCELAMACDIRVASESARFGQPEVSLGIIPGAGGPQRLVRLVGLGKARELIFTGAIIEAAEAERIGLVNQVTPAGEALSGAMTMAAKIAEQGARAVQLAKLVVNAGVRGGADGRDAMEFLSQAYLFETEDKRARMDAFLDARAARRAAKEKSQ